MKRKRRVLWFPNFFGFGLFLLELIIYLIFIACSISGLMGYKGAVILIIICFIGARIAIAFRPNGYERFMKVKKGWLYSYKDFYCTNFCRLSKGTIVYATQLVGRIFSGGYISEERHLLNYSIKKETSEKDGATREYTFIIIKGGNLNDYKMSYKYAQNDNPLRSSTNYWKTYKLTTSKDVILIEARKRNYRFLRQYLDKEQFVGISVKDKSYLEALEKQLLNKTKKQKDV